MKTDEEKNSGNCFFVSSSASLPSWFLNLKNLVPFFLDQLLDLRLVLLGQLLHLFFAVDVVVFGNHAALLFGVQDLVRITAGVADGDFRGFGERLALPH